ncbi:MAG: EF-hand domain-containing protein [Candidatus Sericytochromatia bacterium]
MKNLISLLSLSLITSTLISCANTQNNVVVPVDNKVETNSVSQKTIGEQQRQQEVLNDFYFKYYSEGADSYSISSKNPHIQMLLKAENRIDNIKVLLDENSDKKVTWSEIKKFVTSEPYILDFRKNIVNFSFEKLDKNKDKALSSQEFGTFNKEIKAKEVKDYKLDAEFNSIDYNDNSAIAIEEYENFFIKYLKDKIVWRVKE